MNAAARKATRDRLALALADHLITHIEALPEKQWYEVNFLLRIDGDKAEVRGIFAIESEEPL